MKFKCNLLIFFVFIIQVAFAQDKVKTVLDSILKNNRQLIAQKQYTETYRYEYKTGIFLNNPVVSYDYLFNNIPGLGNQTEFSIVQSFDFPSSYAYKNQIANKKTEQLELMQKLVRQRVVLETKLICNEIVFLNKQKIILDKRFTEAQNQYNDFKKSFEQGNTSIIELNKAKIEFVNAQTLVRQNENQLFQQHQKLAEYNGGKPIQLTDTLYFQHQLLPSFDELFTKSEADEPELKMIELDEEISLKKVKLNKSMGLPKFELGFRMEKNAESTMRGVHFGFTIPLWENKNTVNYAKSEALYSKEKHEEHHISHYSELKQLYAHYQNLLKSYNEYKELITSLNSNQLLNKALTLGQISTLNYYNELSNYYQSVDIFLQIEKDLNDALCKLYKYEL